MTAWINFKKLRRQLDFEKVLRHYGVEVHRKGEQHQGCCPLPCHKGSNQSASFSANLTRGIFQCFGCKAKGNILEFAAMMESVDPADSKKFCEVAGRLQKLFCSAEEKPPEKKAPPANAKLPERTVLTAVNAPLDFELKGLNQEHPYLLGRGFSRETIMRFGIGFTSRGLFKGRIVIPLHDREGKLIGYAGRVIDDNAIREDNPKYRFPSDREYNGAHTEFRKTLFVYNGYRIQEPVDDLIVVEGFTSVWWLDQCGLPNVVATMESDCSDEQAELIVEYVKPAGRVWIMPNGDAEGERFAASLLSKLAPHRFVRWVKLSEGKQPADLSANQLKSCFIT